MIIDVSEAKTHLSKLLDRALEGEEIVTGRAGKPVARLTPFLPERRPRAPGRLAGKIVIAEDFDATPAWLLDAFGSKRNPVEELDQADPPRNGLRREPALRVDGGVWLRVPSAAPSH